jgi:hypothetical protein
MIDEEWDRAEAEMLEQVNLATGAPTVRLPGLFTGGSDEYDSPYDEQARTEECVCAEINTRHCPIHGNAAESGEEAEEGA